MSPTVFSLLSNPAPPPSTFPQVAGRASGGTSILTSDPPLDMGGLPRTVGNVMVLAFRSNSATHTGPSGWTKEVELAHSTAGKMSVWSKTVAASEPSSPAFAQSGRDRCGWVCIEVEDVHGDVQVTIAEGLNPPSLTPAWGSAETLWLTACSVAASDNVLSAPTNYTNRTGGASAASTASSRVRCAMAQRENAAVSEDPAVWAVSGTSYYPIAATVGVRPA